MSKESGGERCQVEREAQLPSERLRLSYERAGGNGGGKKVEPHWRGVPG